MAMKEWIVTYDEYGEVEAVRETEAFVPRKRVMTVRAKTMAGAVIAANRLYTLAEG